jgi:hypothetical protein
MIEREGCEYDWREPSTKSSPAPSTLDLPPFATEEAAINQAEIIVHDYLVNGRFLVCPDEPEEKFLPR